MTRLTLNGPNRGIRTEWSAFAAFRDNVQHHLEGGAPSPGFQALHELEMAVDGGSCSVDAVLLRDEVLRAWQALRTLPVSGGAVSLRSRAIMTGGLALPPQRDTVLANTIGWELPLAATRAGQFEGNALQETMWTFVAAVLHVTATAERGSKVRVQRDGPPPRFTTSMLRASA